jgi:DNA mismatch repair protein MSH5
MFFSSPPELMSGSYIAAVNIVRMMLSICDYAKLIAVIVEETGCAFQIRPHREFIPEKGRDMMLSLAMLNQLPYSGLSSSLIDGVSTSDNNSRSGQAYEFMQRRRQETGDPTLQRRQGMIRLANYSNSETPLCVRR